jgi:catechol 2,3-dioxygenase-like lactoylglutathione lyase family enzyme
MSKPTDPNMILLYVQNPAASAAFYADLLGRPPVDSSPNFAVFALNSGIMLGLWAKHDAQPTPTASGGGGELGFNLPSDEEVRARHADWSRRGLKIIQTPVKMDFGFTFTAADPDGHRLRVFALAAS